MKKLKLVSLALAGGLIFTGCSKQDATYSDNAAAADAGEAQDSLAVPEEEAKLGFTYLAKAVSWDTKNDVETSLAVDGTRLDFTEVGTLKYADAVKPAEGTTLYGLSFTRTYNADYTASTTSAPQGSFSYMWSGNMDAHSLSIPDGVDTGVIVLAAPDNAALELHGEMPGAPDQVVELPSGERTTENVGTAFYADHAGYTGEVDQALFTDKGADNYYLEGEIGWIGTALLSEDREAINEGNAIDIVVNWNGFPNALTDSEDDIIDQATTVYELTSETGETYKGAVMDTYSGDVRFTVPQVESKYTLTVKMSGTFKDMITHEHRSNWRGDFTRTITF